MSEGPRRHTASSLPGMNIELGGGGGTYETSDRFVPGKLEEKVEALALALA